MYLPTIFAYQSVVCSIGHSQTTEKPSGGKTQREKGGGGNKEKKIRNCLRKTSDIKPPVTSVLHHHHIYIIHIYIYIYICMYYTRHFLNLGIGTDFLLWKSFFFFCVFWRFANARNKFHRFNRRRQSRHWVGTWGTADRRPCRWRHT